MLKEKVLEQLDSLKCNNLFRNIRDIKHNGKYINGVDGRELINLASNDYLGLLDDLEYKSGFFDEYPDKSDLFFGSGSSRLLTGSCDEAMEAEKLAANLFGRAANAESRRYEALLFNSGYHANTGIVAALGLFPNVIFIVDRLVHASIIDGLKLSGKRFERYRHNDMNHLRRVVDMAERDGYEIIVIITEAVFSMDGDFADLNEIVKIKREHNGVVLYVDEAHSFGLFGKIGLGLCEDMGCIDDVDIIVAPLGKAAASVGALAVTDSYFKEFLINRMRSLIYSTALPQINFAWTYYFLRNIERMAVRREYLQSIIRCFKGKLQCGADEICEQGLRHSPIIPVRCADAADAVDFQRYLERNGVFAPAIRPPTVPPNGSRLRVSLTASMLESEIELVGELIGKRMYR